MPRETFAKLFEPGKLQEDERKANTIRRSAANMYRDIKCNDKHNELLGYEQHGGLYKVDDALYHPPKYHCFNGKTISGRDIASSVCGDKIYQSNPISTEKGSILTSIRECIETMTLDLSDTYYISPTLVVTPPTGKQCSMEGAGVVDRMKQLRCERIGPSIDATAMARSLATGLNECRSMGIVKEVRKNGKNSNPVSQLDASQLVSQAAIEKAKANLDNKASLVAAKTPMLSSVYYLYCNRCTRIRGSRRTGVTCDAAAEVAKVFFYTDLQAEEHHPPCMNMYVLELYFHNRNCQPSFEDESTKPSYFYDGEQTHGHGYFVLESFNQDEVFRDTYEDMVALFDQWTIDDPFPPGWRIQHLAGYNKEMRKYMGLPNSLEFYQNLICPNKHRASMIRLTYVWAALSNSAFELCADAQTRVYPKPPGLDPPDKTVQDASAIFLGIPCPPPRTSLRNFLNQEPAPAIVHQPPHCDIGPITDKDNGREYEVSKNPHLRGKSKPGSFEFALQDYRVLHFYKNKTWEEVKVCKNKFLYFAGDVAHRGATFAPKDVGLHLGLHVILHSSLHSSEYSVEEPGEFTFDTEYFINGDAAEHAGQLDPRNQLEAWLTLEQDVLTFASSALSMRGKKGQKFASNVQALGKKLLAMADDQLKPTRKKSNSNNKSLKAQPLSGKKKVRRLGSGEGQVHKQQEMLVHSTRKPTARERKCAGTKNLKKTVSSPSDSGSDSNYSDSDNA